VADHFGVVLQVLGLVWASTWLPVTGSKPMSPHSFFFFFEAGPVCNTLCLVLCLLKQGPFEGFLLVVVCVLPCADICACFLS
jgi:hypothetical protein